jgi:hypothetical protein
MTWGFAHLSADRQAARDAAPEFSGIIGTVKAKLSLISLYAQ